MSDRVIVIGGGLAGITAALRLAKAGRQPLLLESGSQLGGRATSFVDVRSEAVLDNCQHVVMGCCTNVLDLYRSLGMSDAIAWTDTLHWMRPDGGVDVVGQGAWPAPLHQFGDIVNMRLLSKIEKCRLARTMFGMLRLGRKGHERWRGRTFGAYLNAAGESLRVQSLFWSPVVVSTCNAHLHEVAATHPLQVFQNAFLASTVGGRMGLPTVPLRTIYKPVGALLEAQGGTLRTRCPVTSIAQANGCVSGVQIGAETLACSTVVCAVPWHKAQKIVPVQDARMVGLNALGHSAILGVHVFVDRLVMHRPHLVLPGRDIQWLFNKGEIDGGADGHRGQHLHAVISAAGAWMDLSEVAIGEAIVSQLQDIVPAIRAASILGIRPIKERRATFLATPAAQAVRPCAAPKPDDIQGLVLCGDWIQTGWPATMEGAVISGHLAAQAVLGPNAAGPCAPLCSAKIPRWLGVER
jgi:squalene-associated FAD-dependent desaturase